VTDDVILNKIASIERCLARTREETSAGLDSLSDQTVQDAVVLNLQRACEASIDLASHLVARHRLGIPQDSRHTFTLLFEAGLLDAAGHDAMRRMVGFRNIAVQEYQRLSLPILKAILTSNLGDFVRFSGAMLKAGDASGR